MNSLLQANFSKFNRRLVGAVLLLTLGWIGIASATTVTPRIELSGNPGTVATDIVRITNEQKQSQTYYTDAENFQSADESGNPVFTGGRVDLASWITIVPTITLGPGETKEVPFSVNIPADAEPGGHFAAIFLQTNPPDLSKGSEVGISSKIGSLVLLTVGGNFQQGANILEFATQNHQYFFTALPINLYFRFQNTGAEYLKPVGDIIIKNMFGHTSTILAANNVDGTVLPKSIRRFEAIWGTPSQNVHGYWNAVKYELRNFAFGRYTATLKVVFGTKTLQSAHASFSFYVIPWQLLLVVILVLIVLFYILRFSIRRYNRYIISQVQRPTRRIKKP